MDSTGTKEAFKSASYSSSLGSSGYNSSQTNINTNSPNANNNNNNNIYDISNIEKLKSPLVRDDALAYEVLSKAGPEFTYQRKDYSHDIGSLANDTSTYQEFSNLKSNYSVYNNYEEACANVIKINPPPGANSIYSASASTINQDPDPIRIVKPNTQNVVYKQQVNIRYLQPPTPPPPAPIIIREKQLTPPPVQPPIIIRQTAPAPPTPPPLTIRERAPTPPPVLEPTIIERPVPPPPAPPRQVIIERLPAPPAKPRPIIYEKWLPYKSTERPVIVQKIKQTNQPPPPKNIIIEYETPKAVAVRQVIEEGIFRVDPATYQCSSQTNGEIRIVDRITDLPIESSRILAQLKLDSSSSSSSSSSSKVNLTNSKNIYSDLISTSSVINTQTSENIEYETITTTVPECLAEKNNCRSSCSGRCNKISKLLKYY